MTRTPCVLSNRPHSSLRACVKRHFSGAPRRWALGTSGWRNRLSSPSISFHGDASPRAQGAGVFMASALDVWSFGCGSNRDTSSSPMLRLC